MEKHQHVYEQGFGRMQGSYMATDAKTERAVIECAVMGCTTVQVVFASGASVEVSE